MAAEWEKDKKIENLEKEIERLKIENAVIADRVKSSKDEALKEFQHELSQKRTHIVTTINKMLGVKGEEIIPISGWKEAGPLIKDILDSSEEFIHILVEDFSKIDQFETEFKKKKGLNIKIVVSPTGPEVEVLKRKLINYGIDPIQVVEYLPESIIGGSRVVLNEDRGLFLSKIENDYYGFYTRPSVRLEKYFEASNKKADKSAWRARLEGKIAPITSIELNALIKILLIETEEHDTTHQFFYLVTKKFRSLLKDKELQRTFKGTDISNLKIVLSTEAKDGGEEETYSKILNEIFKGNEDIVKLTPKDKISYLRFIVCNTIAIILYDFEGEYSYYSIITKKEHINDMKTFIEKIYL